MKKNEGAGISSVRNKDTQSVSGMLLYRTEMSAAGLPMPAASALMRMPSYVIMFCKELTALDKNLQIDVHALLSTQG
jgi:hypothetical protein